mgnify:FL=1|jgi:hypothetical protein
MASSEVRGKGTMTKYGHEREKEIMWDLVNLHFDNLISDDQVEKIKESIAGILTDANEIRTAKLDDSFPLLNWYQPFRGDPNE